MRKHPHSRGREKGFALVELMIAITIGLTLLAGLALVFGNSSQSGSELEKSVRQMENGRYATDMLTEEISLSGYYGELPIDLLGTATPGACETVAANLGWNGGAMPTVPVHITGLTSLQASSLACLPNRKANTPVLVLRRLDTVPILPTAVASATPSTTQFVQSSRCNSDPVATAFVRSSTVADFTLRNLGCTATNRVQRYIHRVYFIASCDECGQDNIPTMKRAELIGDQMVVAPLSQGIDDWAFEFGFDTTNDGIPDVFRTGLSGTALAPDNTWANVVAVRGYVLARTTEPSSGFADGKTYSLGEAGTRGPFTDNFKRRVFTLTARINNVAGFKEIATPAQPASAASP